jgi:hypothetical protein
MGREMVLSVRGSRGHSHLLQGRLLGDGRLALLVRPIATDRTRTKPLTIHGAQRLLSLWAIAEGNEAIAAGAASLHIPHDTSLGNGTEGREGLHENLIIHLVGEVADEDVKVARSVLLVRVIGLIGPVDANFLNTTD